ncbi:MAG: GNAT family N-acetyltransferase [Paracoccaceae bacterium]|nr:GNAT family N-acetyltransferase [Paracoccaceae bacterium]
MTAHIRQAATEDAEFIARIIDMASEGVVPAMFEDVAPPGMTGAEIGLMMIRDETGPFTYRRSHILEEGGTPAGGMITFQLTEEDTAEDPTMPACFLPIRELEQQAIGDWYINVIATLPEARGRGHGRALVGFAEALARKAERGRIALVVAETNTTARALYASLGFKEQDRALFDVTEYGAEPTDALLLVKQL